MPEKNRLLRPDIEQKALRHRQMSLHCFLTSFVRVARAEQVEKTGRLEEKRRRRRKKRRRRRRSLIRREKAVQQGSGGEE